MCCKQDQASKQPLEIGGNICAGERQFLPGRNDHLHRNSTKKKLTVLQFFRADRWLRKVPKLNIVNSNLVTKKEFISGLHM